MDTTKTKIKHEVKLSTIEDALEKAHHILTGIPTRYELDEVEETDIALRKKQAQWLFTQKEALNIDISIAIDYIEKSINGIFICQKDGGLDE